MRVESRDGQIDSIFVRFITHVAEVLYLCFPTQGHRALSRAWLNLHWALIKAARNGHEKVAACLLAVPVQVHAGGSSRCRTLCLSVDGSCLLLQIVRLITPISTCMAPASSDPAIPDAPPHCHI